MTPSAVRITPPDQKQRAQALDPTRSVLVRAPAGSGKTDLLTRRFLRLLSRVEDPAQVVAITFTKAAAAEMRHRILSELEKATEHTEHADVADEFSMEALAARAMDRSRALGWDLLHLPAQLRISTIDSFCREIALQQPLLSGLGGGLDVRDEPGELYRRAARETLERLRDRNPSVEITALQGAIEALLLWRDNNWKDVEDQLISMLERRDQWMHDFVLDRDPDWDELRARLEKPLAHAVKEGLGSISDIFSELPAACDELMAMARFACEQQALHQDLAELAEFPCGPFETLEDLDTARRAYLCVAELLLTSEGALRKARGITVAQGFPADRKREKERMIALLQQMESIPDLCANLHAVRSLPLPRYTEPDWEIVRACFTLLRHAAAQLKVIFAEAGAVDFIEVAQMAQHVLREADGSPSDAALAVADGIHHLLIDEFQDTSRRQNALVASIVSAWPDTAGRTLFVVGDPMQSIYFFRDADAELFPRVQLKGLELPHNEPLLLDYVTLTSNFRTAPQLVNTLNNKLAQVFANNDGSGIKFSIAQPARHEIAASVPFQLHLTFIPQVPRSSANSAEDVRQKEEHTQTSEAARAAQTHEIVDLIRSHSNALEDARRRGEKYRIAVLGRTRSALTPIAAALRNASIPFRAVDLEPLAGRPEVLDALALARAMLLREDRVAWLSVLRAPWCGLPLDDLHRLTSDDSPVLLRRAVPELLAERTGVLSPSGQHGVKRVLSAWSEAQILRTAMATFSMGTWVEQIWLRLGGNACVDATARANLDLLWSRLDQLSAEEPSLLSGALNAALARLTAEPNPEAESDYGVQLMTIHKSKGLEFEVVIVPDMQARSARTHGRLLSWLERGLVESGTQGELTEFLVAPVQPKGEDRGKAKEWVDREYRKRETQEMRRILYVAATRAREELHLFARPHYKRDRDGAHALCEPNNSLLTTAWPALEREVRANFDAWKEAQQEAEIPALAAQAQGNLVEMPRLYKPALLRRLPETFEPRGSLQFTGASAAIVGSEGAALYRRHEGGAVSRALGLAMHALFEHAARLRERMSMEEAHATLHSFEPRVTAHIRATGIAPAQAVELAQRAAELTFQALADPIAAWILTPHPQAASETSWTGVMDGAMRNVRADRVFRAGDAPGENGDAIWWIIDYKTAHPEGDAGNVVAQLRPLFAPQLEMYGRFLRKLHGDAIEVRAGLYYPRLRQFDWWKL